MEMTEQMTKIPAGHGRLLLLAALGAIAMSLSVAPRAHAQQTTVYIEPSSTGAAGDAGAVALSVMVGDVTNLGAFQFELTYDSEILQLVDVQGGPFLGSSGRQVECLTPRRGEASIGLTCVTFGATPDGPTGTGELAVITFESLSTGSSPLRFARLTLTDPPANALPAQAQNATLTVEGGEVSVGAEEATPTPAPGDTPQGDNTPGDTADDGGFAWSLWGPIIGAVAVALLVAGGFVWWTRRSKQP